MSAGNPFGGGGGHAEDSNAQCAKLQQHLSLLRAEFVKCQAERDTLRRDNAALTANSDGSGDDTFAARLLKSIAGMEGNAEYSDISIKLGEGIPIPAHKFVLAARADAWADLRAGTVVDWAHLPMLIGRAVLAWIYSDRIQFPASDVDGFTLTLMRTASGMGLRHLVRQCEESLMASVDVGNCIRYFATADEIGAEGLGAHCSNLISSHWDDFTAADFADMTASLLYSMFKSKTRHPLHAAVRLRREDVVFLYLIEHSQELAVRVNTFDDGNNLPLDIALSGRQEALAKTLVEHKADVNHVDSNGETLLHKAVQRADEFASLFLLENSADVNLTSERSDGDTALHMAARSAKMAAVAERLLEGRARVNAQNRKNTTPLHMAVEADNPAFVDVLLGHGADPEIMTGDGFPPLWFALKTSKDFGDGSIAQKLVAKGASPSAVCSDGNSLLQQCCISGLEEAAIAVLSLVKSSHCDLNRSNTAGNTALHIACSNGLAAVVRALLAKDSVDPNVQSVKGRDTALHLAIADRRIDVIAAIIEKFREGGAEEGRHGRRPNLDLKNAEDQTPLSMALSRGLHEIAMDLLRGGASIDVVNSDGFTLLHNAILDGDNDGAIFLLNNGADIDLSSGLGETPLELCVEKELPKVIEVLCRKGADLCSSRSGQDPPLWKALQKNEDIASILVRHGVDTDGWSPGPDGCQQTLLHRAIDENNEDAAAFLIRSGCDLNSPRREGAGGRGGEEAHDLSAPLHLCCAWGLEGVVRALLEHGANINAQDIEGKTALHCAIENGHQPTISLLLGMGQALDLGCRDKVGQTAFAAAMAFKNNKAAQSILQIDGKAAEQYDARGRNFLHTAVMKNSLESVLFLLSINVNVNSRTQDSNLLTPLLMAVQSAAAASAISAGGGGGEAAAVAGAPEDIIVRNLLLAGASVTARNTSEQTALHIAAENNLPSICSVLLQNGVDFAAADNRGNNALHAAVKEGHINVVRALLTESQIDAEAFNNKGRNPLHVLAVFGKENSSSIFELFVECMAQYPVNAVDAEGNTPLLLAYTKGNGSLCRALVKSGAILGTVNRSGTSIFNCQVATKQLLFRLLDSLGAEPKWGEGDLCEECGAKFGITLRKHHCRHCGRLLCASCSDKSVAIIKYNLTKQVRVCDTCNQVLVVGPNGAAP